VEGWRGGGVEGWRRVRDNESKTVSEGNQNNNKK